MEIPYIMESFRGLGSSHLTRMLSDIGLRRGLSTDGSLAQVRGRVRVARAKERKDAKWCAQTTSDKRLNTGDCGKT